MLNIRSSTTGEGTSVDREKGDYRRKKILFICGSRNQTTQMHKIALELPECEHYFSPHYHDGIYDLYRRMGLLEFSILGNKIVKRCFEYLASHELMVDYKGTANDYDLVVTCADIVVPKNIRDKTIVLVQEGMTDPENFLYHLVKLLPFLPRWIASTSTFGLSNAYDRLCVASEGYRELFTLKGVDPGKIVVTGIPNFDNCAQYLDNDFPFKHYVLVCTSDARDTFKIENRRRVIEQAVRIADGRTLIFKLHPNENIERATREIRQYAEGALVFEDGNTEHMIANCDVLITQFSSTVFVGIALGKEVYSNYDIEELKKLCPLQNNSASRNIAAVCRDLLETEPSSNRFSRDELFKQTALQPISHTTDVSPFHAR